MITAAAGDDGYLDWDAEASSEGLRRLSRLLAPCGRGRRHAPEPRPPVGRGRTRPCGTATAPAAAAAASRSPRPPGSRTSPTGRPSAAVRKRAVADVSADADPYTGVAIYDSTRIPRKLRRIRLDDDRRHERRLADHRRDVRARRRRANGVAIPRADPLRKRARRPDLAARRHRGSNGECANAFDERATGLLHARRRTGGGLAARQRRSAWRGPGYDGPTGVGTPDGIAAFQVRPKRKRKKRRKAARTGAKAQGGSAAAAAAKKLQCGGGSDTGGGAGTHGHGGGTGASSSGGAGTGSSSASTGRDHRSCRASSSTSRRADRL